VSERRLPPLLALDVLSRPSIVAALVDGEQRSARGPSEHALVGLDRLVGEVLGPVRPGVVGVVVGPGPVLGLRAGVAFTRALASVHGASCVAIDDAEAFAASLPHHEELWVLSPVGRGRTRLAHCVRGRIVAERLVANDAVELPPGAVAAGRLRRGVALELVATEPTAAGLLAATMRGLLAGRLLVPGALAPRYDVDAGVRLAGSSQRGGQRA
jgi:tRNA A37 threonylcarbamoyladenosine modification protein TsaB